MKFPVFLILLTSMITTSLIADESADLASLTNSHTQFALSLYPVLDVSDSNLVCSPYSISTCLSMIYIGARGETQTQMETALHLKGDRRMLAKTTFSLSQSMALKNEDPNGYQLNIANSLWVDQETFLLSDFRYAITEQFKAKLGMINFNKPDTATKTINDWIATQTQGKIKDLISTGDISEYTKLILTNAVYFKGEWANPFNAKTTQDWPFHPTPETTTTVKMMQQTFSTPYFENELMQAAALPFNGITNSNGQLALVILLPKSAENFQKMVQALPENLNDWISALIPARINLKLPKFNLSNRFELEKPLKTLGMEDPFGSEANFTGIDGMRNLYISTILHEALFDLDENGITAAAATAAVVNITSVFPNEPPITINADHPFLFFLIDLKSQEMLFMGKVIQPGS